MSAPTFHFDVSGPHGSWKLSVPTGRVVWIGRDSDAEILLSAANISRRHASVEWSESGLHVADASANGTVVNGELLHMSSCFAQASGTTLQVGAFRIGVRVEAANAPRRPFASGLAVELRRSIHRQLVEHLDLPSMNRSAMNTAELRPKVLAALGRIISSLGSQTPNEQEGDSLAEELADEALGLGPLERLLADSQVNEIMVVDPRTIFVDRGGKMELTGLAFTDDDAVRAVIERIVTPLGRRIDESVPIVDARLRDGSRVNAVIPPLSIRGPCITIRKFAETPLQMADLVRFGSVTPAMARFLEQCVKVRKNIVVSGGTGSGKTTLLNVLSSAIPAHERVITVEDAAELRFTLPHVVSLEARPPNLEGKGEYTIRDLVRNALRMRPDRIVVGECRGGEAVDMLQAMNTGHEGSLTTTHANSPKEAVARIEMLCLMAGLELPVHAIRRQIAASVHVVVQQTRLSDGSRRVSSISEIAGIDADGEVELREIFGFRLRRTTASGSVEGEFVASGYLPSFLDQFVAHGLVLEGFAP